MPGQVVLTADLFRREALDARREEWLGRVQVRQPFTVRVVSALAVVLVVLLVAYAWRGLYTRRVHATGMMAPPSGLVVIGANAAGLIVRQAATEGMHVRKGDVLFVVDVDANSSTGPMQQHVMEQLRQQKALLEDQKRLRLTNAPVDKQTLVAKARFLAQQRTELQEQIARDAHVLPLMEAALTRMQAARSAMLLTETQYQSQLYSYTQFMGSHATFVQNEMDVQGKLSDVTSKLLQFDNDLSHDINDLNRQIAEVGERIAQSEGHRNNVIIAPDDGELTAVRVSAGQQVAAGAPLVTLLPTGHALQAELYVHSGSVGFLRVGEPVLLRYQAFPYQRFGLYRGHVTEVTHAPVSANGSGDPSAPQSESRDTKSQSDSSDIYRIRVMPDQQYVLAYGKRHALDAGMTVEADIATETRPLYQWLLSPLSAMRDDVYAVSGGLSQ